MMANRTDRPIRNESRANRPPRVPLDGSSRDVINIRGKDPNYYYRVVADKDDRIQRFVDAWWEFVPRSESPDKGDRGANTESDTSSYVTRNLGAGLVGYLMRIPKELHDEDRANKHAKIDENEAQMRQRVNSGADGTYGNVRFKDETRRR